MRRLAWCSLLLPALVLTGCGKDDPTGPRRLTILECEDGQRYAIGASVAGTLTAADCREPGGTSAFADFYEIVLPAPGPVSITLRPTAGPDEIVAVLLRPDESQVDFGFADQGDSTSIGGDLPAGTYYLVIAALESTELIGYALSSRSALPPMFGCAMVSSYTIGSTVTGSLASGDCQTPDSEAFDLYRFTQTAAGPVSISLQPAGGTFIAFLAVRAGGTEEVLVAQYAIPGSPAVIGGNLAAGTYVIVVAASQAGQTGGYTLGSSRTLPPPPPPFFGCTTAAAYTLGGTVAGSLASSDCLVQNGFYADRFDFTVGTGRTVTIDLASTEFDTYLMLFDGAGQLIATNDDANGGTLDSRLTITLPAGTYAILASSFLGYATGAYTLSSAP